jgi:tripartite-type tricarboxylate transporter receptor subunit TctC
LTAVASVLLSVLLSGALAAVPVGACAQGLVKAPVRILVPVGAGGTSDIAARLLADYVRDAVGQPVHVENRTGATGRIAAETLKHAAPDGTTFMVAPIAVTVLAPLVFRQLNYDPVRDFAPVAQIATYQYALAVPPDHPARTAPEFVAWAKANPRRANVGTAGAGSVPHFLAVVIGQATGIPLEHVAYKNLTPLLADMAGGQIASSISVIPDLIELHRAGRLRIVATSGAARSPLLPGVPTFREQGMVAIEVVGWTALYAPARTPKAVIEQVSAAVARGVRAPEVQHRLVALGLEPTGTTPEALAALIAADSARWASIVKASGFTAE